MNSAYSKLFSLVLLGSLAAGRTLGPDYVRP